MYKRQGDLEGLSFEDLAAIPTVSPVLTTSPPALTTTAVRATTLAVLVEKGKASPAKDCAQPKEVGLLACFSSRDLQGAS